MVAVAEPTAETTFGARHMVRRGLKGALATVDFETGAPYASMVLLATDTAGAPITLISALARHTRNLRAHAAASLMIDTSNAAGDAESGGRITLTGRFVAITAPAARTRFLARHPAAGTYADFADFAFYRLEIVSAHLIEGFGRIIPLPGAALILPAHDEAHFTAHEAAAVAELQRQWPDVTGLDPEGVDLRLHGRGERIDFEQAAATADAAHVAAAKCLASHLLNH
jgi:heme iron utilization protein